jgi:hypothetical protein
MDLSAIEIPLLVSMKFKSYRTTIIAHHEWRQHVDLENPYANLSVMAVQEAAPYSTPITGEPFSQVRIVDELPSPFSTMV